MNHAFLSGTTSRSPSLFDVCIVGHITKDIIRTGKRTRETIGGTAFYTAVALKKLGLNVGVLTKMSESDKASLLHEPAIRGMTIFWKDSRTTSVFENTYTPGNLDTRLQQIKAIGAPFLPEDVDRITATTFHVGPLTNRDIPVQLLERLSTTARIVSLDVQGMLRPARTGPVREVDWREKQEGLAYVDILKANEKEALVLSGEKTVDRAVSALVSLGPKEVIITMGSRGSLICAKQGLHRIPFYSPRKTEDPTGCGDTYMAGYLSQRLKGTTPERAGRFAAAMASLKLERSGPFNRSEVDINALLSRK